MDKYEKLQLLNNFHILFESELVRIPEEKIRLQKSAKPEVLAKQHFTLKGYEVFFSRVRNGYRSIGSEFYWKGFVGKRTGEDVYLITKLKWYT